MSPSPTGRGVGVRGNEASPLNDRCRTALRCCVSTERRSQMDSSFRWNDGDVGSPCRECPCVTGQGPGFRRDDGFGDESRITLRALPPPGQKIRAPPAPSCRVRCRTCAAFPPGSCDAGRAAVRRGRRRRRSGRARRGSGPVRCSRCGRAGRCPAAGASWSATASTDPAPRKASARKRAGYFCFGKSNQNHPLLTRAGAAARRRSPALLAGKGTSPELAALRQRATLRPFPAPVLGSL